MLSEVPLHIYQREIDRAATDTNIFQLRFVNKEIEKGYLAELNAKHTIGKRITALLALLCIFIFGAWETASYDQFHSTVLLVRIFSTTPLLLLILILHIRPYSRWQQELISVALISVCLGSQLASFIQSTTTTLPGVVALVFCNTLTFLLTGLTFWRKFLTAFIINISHFSILIAFDASLGLAIISLVLQSAFFLTGIYHSIYLEQISRENFLRTRLLSGLLALDHSSGPWSRHHFDQHLAKLIHQAERENTSFLLAILDVDEFRAYNENYGRLAGNECLMRINQTLRRQEKHSHDFVAHFGGEEFILIYWNVPGRSAQDRVNQTLDAIRRLRIPHEASSVGPFVTASVGVSLFNPANPSPKHDLMMMADRCLKLAKYSGRDCVYSAEQPTDAPSLQRAV